jgi:hypothetical protein
MQTVVTARLLDAEERLLGWAQVPVETRNDGCLWPLQPQFVMLGEHTGAGVLMSLHWADVHIEVRIPLPTPVPVTEATPLALEWGAAYVLRLGVAPMYLAPVTVRTPVVVGMVSGAAQVIGLPT